MKNNNRKSRIGNKREYIDHLFLVLEFIPCVLAMVLVRSLEFIRNIIINILEELEKGGNEYRRAN